MNTTQPRLVGARIARVEDPRFLRGEARYIANIVLAGMRHARFVRSPLAHARILGIDTSAVPEGVAVFTGDEWAEYGIECTSRYEGFQPASMPILAVGKVRYVGEPVAMVIADDPYLAEDAAEAVMVDYDPLPALTTVDEALASDAPLIHEHWETNLYVPRTYSSPDFDEQTKNTLSVSGRLSHSRHSGVPMEGRAVLAEFTAGRFKVHTATQIPHLVRTAVATAMGLAEREVQIISPDVGGGFGVKAQAYPEEVACALATRALGVPVKWIEDRREHFMASHHSREHTHQASLHFTEEGMIKSLSAELYVDMGAYSVFPWTATMDTGMAMGILPGPYRFTGYKVDGFPTCTNKTPYGAYRGVSRPAACFTIERLVDWMARDRGLDRLEARRMNLVRQEDYPWTNPGGLVYDGGSLDESIDVMKEWIGYDTLVESLRNDRKQ
ncbi:MAG: molybdopterin cofactor-binding domain-containing protein, partial [Acidimicrobiia bacterium]